MGLASENICIRQHYEAHYIQWDIRMPELFWIICSCTAIKTSPAPNGFFIHSFISTEGADQCTHFFVHLEFWIRVTIYIFKGPESK